MLWWTLKSWILLIAIACAFIGPPLHFECRNQLSCCFDTCLSTAALSSSIVMDEAERSASIPLSPAVEAINMEVTLTEQHSLCLGKTPERWIGTGTLEGIWKRSSQFLTQIIAPRFKIVLIHTERIYAGKITSEKLLVLYPRTFFCDPISKMVLIRGQY